MTLKIEIVLKDTRRIRVKDESLKGLKTHFSVPCCTEMVLQDYGPRKTPYLQKNYSEPE